MHENDIASEIVAACICVHKELGPGLLESVYEAALALELAERGHNVQRQLPIHAVYRGKDLGLGFRADVIVDGLVLIEAKSIEALTNVHYKQVLSYLRLTNLRLGLLVNFNAPILTNNIKRIVNGLT